MGKRGVRPKPTPLRILHGDQKKRINTAEPVPPARTPGCPNNLSPEARRIWRYYAPELAKRGLLTMWDRDTFAVFCASVANWRQAQGALDTTILIKGSRGDLKKNPAAQIVRDQAALIRAFAQEFGMTPSARSGIKHTPDEKYGDLSAILS